MLGTGKCCAGRAGPRTPYPHPHPAGPAPLGRPHSPPPRTLLPPPRPSSSLHAKPRLGAPSCPAAAAALCCAGGTGQRYPMCAPRLTWTPVAPEPSVLVPPEHPLLSSAGAGAGAGPRVPSSPLPPACPPSPATVAPQHRDAPDRKAGPSRPRERGLQERAQREPLQHLLRVPPAGPTPVHLGAARAPGDAQHRPRILLRPGPGDSREPSAAAEPGGSGWSPRAAGGGAAMQPGPPRR